MSEGHSLGILIGSRELRELLGHPVVERVWNRLARHSSHLLSEADRAEMVRQLQERVFPVLRRAVSTTSLERHLDEGELSLSGGDREAERRKVNELLSAENPEEGDCDTPFAVTGHDDRCDVFEMSSPSHSSKSINRRDDISAALSKEHILLALIDYICGESPPGEDLFGKVCVELRRQKAFPPEILTNISTWRSRCSAFFRELFEGTSLSRDDLMTASVLSSDDIDRSNAQRFAAKSAVAKEARDSVLISPTGTLAISVPMNGRRRPSQRGRTDEDEEDAENASDDAIRRKSSPATTVRDRKVSRPNAPFESSERLYRLYSLKCPIYSTMRYTSEFTEIGPLGKGGAAKVFKVRHVVDESCYAMKKVSFAMRDHHALERSFSEVIQEVKLLARLNFQGIVRYYQAWLEPSKQEDEESSPRNAAREGGDSSDGQPIVSPHRRGKKIRRSRQRTTDEERWGVDHEVAGLYFEGNSEESLKEMAEGGLSDLRVDCGLEEEDDKEDADCEEDREVDDGEEDDDVEGEDGGDGHDGEVFSPYFDFDGDDGRVARSFVDQRASRFVSRRMSPEMVAESLKDGGSGMDICAQLWNRKRRKFEAVLYIQMELCDKGTLEEYMWRGGSRMVDANDCEDVFHSICLAVNFLHSQGVIHRDLKPSNIFMSDCPESRVKIGDFGLAIEKGSQKRLRGSPGLGTPTYASPEQTRGEVFDEKTDIYSLGIILFELFCPFSTYAERAAVLDCLRHEDSLTNTFGLSKVCDSGKESVLLEHLSKFSRVLKMVKSCLASDPKQRPSITDILTSCLLEEDASTLIPSPVRPPSSAEREDEKKCEAVGPSSTSPETESQLRETVACQAAQIRRLRRRIDLLEKSQRRSCDVCTQTASPAV